VAHALRGSALQPAIVMIAEAWQAGALLLPEGVDCVTLPALRREANGAYNPRFLLDVSDQDLIALRTRVIRSAIEVFDPDVLVVDYLPLGVAGELATTLDRLRTRGNTRCVLGLREVLYDGETVRRTWADGQRLAEAFLQAHLPDDTTGVLVTGPLMPWEQRQQVRYDAQQRSRFRVLDFVPEPIALLERADRVIAMGGYNTCCEILSFEKHALLVPRVAPEAEQWIRAERLRDLGLVEV